MRLMIVVALVASMVFAGAVAVIAVAGFSFRSRHHRALVDAPTFRVPPGWYPDPTADGCQRWWDGMTWTDQAVGEAPPA